MSENKITNQLFTELFRPHTLDSAIIVDRIKSELSRGLVDNILFVGTQGAGKTTLSRILCQGHDVLELNASLDRGIDVVREQIVQFAATTSLMESSDKLKVILLEELDSASNDFFGAMRAVIEKYHNNVRFVGNCNYINKIPEPIQSRFNVIPIDPITKDEEEYLFNGYLGRIKYILDYLKISYTEQDVATFVRNDFPDMRSLVKKVQQLYTRGNKELTPDMLSASFDCSDLFKIIMSKPDPWNNYKQLISDWGNKAEDAILQIGENFPEYVHTVNPNFDGKIPQIIIATAEHQHMLVTAIDKFVVLASLVLKLQHIINS